MLRSNAVGLKEEEDELAAAGDDGVARPRVTTPAGETTAAGAVRVLDKAASGSAWNGGAKRGGDRMDGRQAAHRRTGLAAFGLDGVAAARGRGW